MSKYGDIGEKVTDSGILKISDLLHEEGEEICALLMATELKESTQPGGNSYLIYSLFSEEQGEITLSTTGSNFGKCFEKAIKDKVFNPDTMPLLAIGLDRPPSVYDGVDQKTGNAIKRTWHNVYIAEIKPVRQDQRDAISDLRIRAAREMKTPPIQDNKPYGPAVANARNSVQRELENAYASDSEVPF